MDGKVFGDADEELERLKQQISQETGLVDPNSDAGFEKVVDDEEEDLEDSIDEDGVEWFEDEDATVVP